MIEARVIADAVFRIEGDGDSWFHARVIDHRADYWMVATWLVDTQGRECFAERLVPMARLPHWEESDIRFRIGIPLPAMLLDPDTAPALLRPWGCILLQGWRQVCGHRPMT
jgi:hypothetical protein